MTQENDIVLIYYEDNPLVLARIESITPDIKRGWYHVKLLMLQIPVQVATWLLRDTYISGSEFTMGGKKMRMERVECPPDEIPVPDRDKSKEEGKPAWAKVISLKDLKKKQRPSQ